MAHAGAPRLDPTRLDAAFSFVARQAAQPHIGYASLAVARSDGLIRAAAYGRDGEYSSLPRTAIASITKPIVATAVLQLVEAGSLVLVEPVATYLPGFEPRVPAGTAHHAEAINAWHILTHTSGLINPPDAFYMAGHRDGAAILEWLGTSSLLFAPGTAYAYASESFFVLSELMHRLGGADHPTFLRERVFEPLGMAATTFDPAAPGPSALPLAGDLGMEGISAEQAMAEFVALAMPGGGLWSTAEDVVHFGRAMLAAGSLDGHRVLGRAFVELMTRHHTAGLVEHDTGRPATYGLGWGLPGLGRGSPASRSAFAHSGATGSYLLVDPTYDLVIAYLRNEWGAPTAPTDSAIQAVYAALD
jgi:CubicO group peptidase (beta-lactamase class C family)